MLEEERIKLAITLQSFMQGYHRQHEKWDEFFPFRSKDPHCAILIEYCNHVETLYPLVDRNTWSNEEGEATQQKSPPNKAGIFFVRAVLGSKMHTMVKLTLFWC